jgi:VanZ family protein
VILVFNKPLFLKNILRYHIPGILWILVILVLTCLPGTLIPRVPVFLDLFQPDKLVHIFLFAILIFFLLLDLLGQFRDRLSYWLAVLIALNIGIFLGGITELLQGTMMVLGRQCSVYDFIANVAGCFAGWGIFVLWKKKKKMSTARRSL